MSNCPSFINVTYPHRSVPYGVRRQTGGRRWRRRGQYGLGWHSRHRCVKRVRFRWPPGRQPPGHRGHAGAASVGGRLPKSSVQHQEQHSVDERMAIGHVQRNLQQRQYVDGIVLTIVDGIEIIHIPLKWSEFQFIYYYIRGLIVVPIISPLVVFNVRYLHFLRKR